jgi:Cu2+-exporting ATPase
VLARAQVSVAMRGAADLAHSSADVVLMSDRLAPLLGVFRVSHRALRTIRQNLAWAACYNAAAVPLAALGYVTPAAAAIGMSVSSLAVVFNALRLTRPSRSGVARFAATTVDGAMNHDVRSSERRASRSRSRAAVSPLASISAIPRVRAPGE